MFSKSWLMQMSTVSLRGMLVKSEPLPKLPINNLGSCYRISSANSSESLTKYSFLVKRFNMGSKNLTRSYGGVCKANKIGWVGGTSTLLVVYVFCKVPYVVPGLVPTGAFLLKYC